MGREDAVAGARRSVLGAGASVQAVNGELAYRFTGAQANGACSWPAPRALTGQATLVFAARFRLNALASSSVFCRWGASLNSFLLQISATGEVIIGAVSGVNSNGRALSTSGFGLVVGRTYTMACAVQTPAPTGAAEIELSVDGRTLSLPTTIFNNGIPPAFFDGNATLQMGVANDGSPMNGAVMMGFLGASVSRVHPRTLNRITSSPWALFDMARRFVNPAAAITVYRPGSDVAVSGWTAVGAATRAAALADESGATYAESPDLSTPDTQTWTPPFPAGPASLEINAERTAGVGALRIVFLDAGAAVVGTTAWQTLTGTPADYVLTATVSATSPQFRIEVQP